MSSAALGKRARGLLFWLEVEEKRSGDREEAALGIEREWGSVGLGFRQD